MKGRKGGYGRINSSRAFLDAKIRSPVRAPRYLASFSFLPFFISSSFLPGHSFARVLPSLFHLFPFTGFLKRFSRAGSERQLRIDLSLLLVVPRYAV